MKKSTIIALVVAFVLMAAGTVILVMGLSYADDGTRESLLIAQEITVTEDFDNIQIDTEDCDVIFVPFNGTADPYVTIREKENTVHSVTVKEGTLIIKMTDNRNWTDHIGIGWEKMDMTVHLPQKQYENIFVTTATGDVEIPKALSTKEMVLRSDTGDIWCEGVVGELLDCMTSTGDISVRDSDPEKIKLQSNSGDLNISGCDGEEVHMTTDTGEVDVKNVTVELFTCSCDTGEVELEWVNAADYLQIRTTTGGVGIENCDAGRVDIETDTGDVYGSFMSPKWFSAKSGTGNVNVPNTPEGGECRIESNTGDISFIYDEVKSIQ